MSNKEPDFSEHIVASTIVEMQENPYDSFMRKHLQHYGYYTGRNQGFRQTFTSYADWEKNYSFALSSSSESESESDSEEGKGRILNSWNRDNKLQEELLKTTQLVYDYKDGKGMVPKLREPRNLYAIAKELGPQQAARWPSDIQVVPHHPKHIRYIPPEPETFYTKTGLEKCPMVRGEERGGRLVFMYEPRSTFFVRSRVGGLRSGPERVAVELDRLRDDKTLIFESRFESGNLAKAVQVGDYDYELWLRYDLYTSKHTQWFYFSISNTRPNVTYRFSIVNFMKPDSLYNYGMKPLLYSEKDALQKKIGWVRRGNNIKYYKNNLKYDTSKGDKPFYSLTWTVEFPHSHDTVYFSHCFPYTYTDLQDYLLDLANDPIKSKICKQRVLCRTLAGNLVYVLTITSPSQNPEDIKHKKAVVLTARVHPGESNASWMMKGFLDYLTGNSADAKLLRDTFIFKIVPMLNPDGVIVGNYRCSLAGRDLNRNYKTVLKDSYPSVWHSKQMIRRLLQERDIVVYCDLHGHSRKQNVFIYGCENRHNPQKRLRERIFPVMLSKNASDKFTYDSCKFKIQKSKEGTGRIVMWSMGIMNSYTMEATFCGSTLGKKKGCHFSVADFEALGYHFCDTLLDYCDPDTTKSANVLYELEERLKKDIRDKLASKGIIPTGDVNLSDEYSELESSDDGGSDSSISDGPPVHLQFVPQRVDSSTNTDPPKKKKKLKTKKERDRARSMKEDGKKGDKLERPSTDQPISDKKSTLTGHQTAHARQEKSRQNTVMDANPARVRDDPSTLSEIVGVQMQLSTQGMRYTNASSPKRPKSALPDESQYERVNSGLPAPGNVQERMEERHQKRPRKSVLETAKCEAEDTQALATDYLEALTNAYLRNGVLYNNDRDQGDESDTDIRAAPHFRYTGSTNQGSNMPFSLDGLCPHHEQAFAAQLMAHQLQNMSGDQFCQNWLQQGIQGQPKEIKPFHHKNQDELMNKILGMPSDPNIDEFVRSQLVAQSSISPIERRSSQPRHILEVSAAQQRQQDILQSGHSTGSTKKDKGSVKSHPAPFDDLKDRDKMGMSSRLKAQIPSATFVNYETFNVSQVALGSEAESRQGTNLTASRSEKDTNHSTLDNDENAEELADELAREASHHGGHRHNKKSGRKSRMGFRKVRRRRCVICDTCKSGQYATMYLEGMRDSSEEEELITADGPDYVKDPHSHKPPRVKSAKSGEEINSAIQSIRDLRQSLASSAVQSNLTPTAGNYIKKLLKEELTQANEEIDQLSARLQHNIDEKQKQYNTLVEKKSSAETKSSAERKSTSESKSKPPETRTDKEFKQITREEKIQAKVKMNRSETVPSPEFVSSAMEQARREARKVGNGTKLNPNTNNNSMVNVPSGKSANIISEHSSATSSRIGAKTDCSKIDSFYVVPSEQQSASRLNGNNHLSSLSPRYSSEQVYTSSKTNKYSNQNSSNSNLVNLFSKLKHPLTNGSSPSYGRGNSGSSSSSREEGDGARSKSCTGTEKMSETSELGPRVRSAKGAGRQVVETVPTKISLMITQDHEDSRNNVNKQFLPLSRSVRGPFAKGSTVKRK